MIEHQKKLKKEKKKHKNMKNNIICQYGFTEKKKKLRDSFLLMEAKIKTFLINNNN